MEQSASPYYAAEQIRKAIVSGQFKIGERLVERELAERISVSRHPIREALRLLEREGFVEIFKNRGAVVKELDESSITEVFAIRSALGTIALRHLCSKDVSIAPASLKRLERLATDALNFALAGDQERASNKDIEFQQAIVEATGLPRTSRYFGELTSDIRRFFVITAGKITRDGVAEARTYILPLLEAIKKKDFTRADSVWQSKFKDAMKRNLRFVQTTKGNETAP